MADFFNKVLVGINKGVNSVSENSKIFVEKTKLSTTIKDKETEKNKILQQLGNMVYQMQKRGEIEFEQFKDMCSEIDSYNTAIEELNVQLKNLQNGLVDSNDISTGVRCSCGHYNRSDAVFCAGCGARLDQTGDE